MDMEFQMKMSTDEMNQKMYYSIDHWNEKKTKSSNIVFNLVCKF
jgi:hypothetical protein